jgi:hypothetical protein
MASGIPSSESDLNKQNSNSDMLTSINSIQFSKYNVTGSSSGGGGKLSKQKSDLTALRRNSDTILINTSGGIESNLLKPKQVSRLKSANAYRLKSSNLLSSHVKEEDQNQLQQLQTSTSSNLNIVDNLNENSNNNLSQNSLFSNDNYLSAPSPITPQSPVQSPSSPTQSQSSLILNKYSISNSNLNSNNSNINSTTPSPATSKANLTSSSTKSVLTHLQNLNNKFLRKRHSVSILKFNSNSNNSSNHTAALSNSGLSISNSTNLNNINSQSFSSQFNKMTNNASNYNQKNTLMLPLTNSVLLVDSYDNSLQISNNSGINSKFSNKKAGSKSGSASHNSSMKSKRKQKRSKSAPINQRRPAKLTSQSMLYALLSPNYVKKAANSSKNVKFNECIFCSFKKQNNLHSLNYSGLINISTSNSSSLNSASISQTR